MPPYQIVDSTKIDINIKASSEGLRDMKLVGDENSIVLFFSKILGVEMSKDHEVKLSREEIKMLSGLLQAYSAKANKLK